jgi:glycosyltransferase involved in cell wall biosynthesis
MNLIIDVTRLVRRVVKNQTLTGIDRVSMAYVQHYRTLAQALVRWGGRSFILSDAQSKQLFAWLVEPTSVLGLRWTLIKGIVANCFSKNKPNTFLLNTGHIGLGQSDYLRMMRRQGVKPIFFVHDLIPITYPEYCSPGEAQRHKDKMNYVLTHACGVITNSNATRDDLIEYACFTKQRLPQIKTALLAPGIPSVLPGSRPIDKPYFVILSTIEPRKNHLLLLQLWRYFIQTLGDKAPHLVVIGQRGWECENIVDLLDRCEMLQGFVTEVAGCTDADLVSYLYHSQALLFPSFIEGYGLPLVEALTLNVPVLASDLPVFREIAGDIPDYSDPLDGQRWKELILEYAQPNSAYRAAQMQRLQHFEPLTWETHFIVVDSFLKELHSIY